MDINQFVWKYFYMRQFPLIQCKICDVTYNGYFKRQAENHISLNHLQILFELMEEILVQF